jgi:diguanylate cyclase (GGDEF)-like protein
MISASSDTVSFDDAVALVDEIQRLRLEVAKSNARIAELEDLAQMDPLVNLPNRQRCLRALADLVARVRAERRPAAIIFVEVDGLKAINDRFGHVAGDSVLLEIARLLVASATTAEFVGRLSGDEFAILLEPTDELNAWQRALRIVETVDECDFALDGKLVPLSVAVGVGMIEASDTTETALMRADREMRRIKAISDWPAPAADCASGIGSRD